MSEREYNVGAVIGSGMYGTVNMVKYGDELYAMKELTQIFEGIDCLTEIDILSSIRHLHLCWMLNLLTPHNCLDDTQKSGMISGIAWTLPLADHTLYNVLDCKAFKLPHRLATFYRTSTALCCLHRHKIVHCDIKSDNVVLRGKVTDADPMLIDFGLALRVDSIEKGKDYCDVLVTLDYRPPEILAGGRHYSGATDIWSMGILLLNMLNGRSFINIPIMYDYATCDYHFNYLEYEIKNNKNTGKVTKYKQELKNLRRLFNLESSGVADDKGIAQEILSLKTSIDTEREAELHQFLTEKFTATNIEGTLDEILSASIFVTSYAFMSNNEVNADGSKQIINVDRKTVISDAKELLKSMLSLNPADRPTIKTVVDHKLFDLFRYEDLHKDTYDERSDIQNIDTGMIDSDFRDLLKAILVWCQDSYPELKVEVLFLAVDLLYRVSGKLRGQKAHENKLTAVCCLWMAIKLCNDITRSGVVQMVEAVKEITNGYVTPELLVNEEIAIVIYLKGYLYRHFLYDAARHNEDVKTIFFDHIICREGYVKYHTLDPQKLVSELTYPEGQVFLDKDITIKQLD